MVSVVGAWYEEVMTGSRFVFDAAFVVSLSCPDFVGQEHKCGPSDASWAFVRRQNRNAVGK